jgi:hypothetical protein
MGVVMAFDSKEYLKAYRTTDEYRAKAREYKRRKRQELINSPEYIEAKRQKALIVAENYKAKKRRSDLKYYQKNKETINAKARERWRLAHPPKPAKPKLTEEEKLAKQRAYSIAYYYANKEQCKANINKWMQENKDRMRELVRAWRKKNPEKYKESRKKYNENNKERIKELAKANAERRFAERPDEIRARRKASKARTKAKYPEKYIEMQRAGVRRAGKKRVEVMHEAYINHLLTKSSGIKLKVEEIPKELIEAKRLQLLIKRELNK